MSLIDTRLRVMASIFVILNDLTNNSCWLSTVEVTQCKTARILNGACFVFAAAENIVEKCFFPKQIPDCSLLSILCVNPVFRSDW